MSTQAVLYKPRVFVSSVMDDFEEYRQAVKQAIVVSGAAPIMAEDFPASPYSSRNACLDGVASSDIVIIIIGQRGGWKTPSGKLVVEEEYEQAHRTHKQVLVFLQDIERDEDAQQLADRLSDYVDGHFRPTFVTPTELAEVIKAALAQIVSHITQPRMDETMIDQLIQQPTEIQNETTLRFVLVPTRVEEVIDPVDLESVELEDQIMDLGHRKDVALFSHRFAKTVDVTTTELIITQGKDDWTRTGTDFVCLRINTNGVIAIDLNVTGRPNAGNIDNDHMAGSYILEGDVEQALQRCFAFSGAFWHARDGYKKYDQMIWNASMGGMDFKPLLAEPPKGNSIYMRMSDDNRPCPAFDQPRQIVRTDLLEINNQISAAITMFRRRLKNE